MFPVEFDLFDLCCNSFTLQIKIFLTKMLNFVKLQMTPSHLIYQS